MRRQAGNDIVNQLHCKLCHLGRSKCNRLSRGQLTDILLFFIKLCHTIAIAVEKRRMVGGWISPPDKFSLSGLEEPTDNASWLLFLCFDRKLFMLTIGAVPKAFRQIYGRRSCHSCWLLQYIVNPDITLVTLFHVYWSITLTSGLFRIQIELVCIRSFLLVMARFVLLLLM